MRPSHFRAAVLVFVFFVLANALPSQAPQGCWNHPAPAAPADSARLAAALARRTLTAARLSGHSPGIDGALSDAAWCNAPAVNDFIQSRPNPGAIASLSTMARVLYDDEALYVAVRAFDAHPDSISAPYPRRDNEVNGDWIFFEIDSRFDHRSGFSFGVNPRGVQVDGSWWNDVNYDAAWNAIWQSAAQIDSLGWTAEFRIPFSQLALSKPAPGAALTFGMNVYRTSPHAGETSNWAPRLPSVVGVISHFNELRGLVVPPRSARFDIDPYVATTESDTRSMSIGGDIRFRPTSSTALALTVHPDFGQVEADPSQINLTTFETFLPEQRPLFIEGADVFQFNSALAFATRGTSFADESPFYSRRIGRRPHGACPPLAVACTVPGSATVLGALRASGRNAGGWAGGIFHAWTNDEQASFDDVTGIPRFAQVEPLTNFTVARASREFNNGSAAVGALATVVDRLSLDDAVASILPARAITFGIDGRSQFAHGGYEFTSFVLATSVNGSKSSIAALRTEPQHRFADSASSNSLRGVSAQARIARIDGELQWSLASRLVSPGFDMNDAGFQRNANWLLLAGNWKFQKYRPHRVLRRWSVGSTQAGVGWTTQGRRRAANADITVSGDLKNYWGGSLSLDHEFGASDPEVLRGGPSLRLPGRDNWQASVYSDTRRRWLLLLNAEGMREGATASHETHLAPEFTSFVNDRLQLGLSPTLSFGNNAWQYVAQASDSTLQRHYVLGALRQTTASLSTRATYAFSSTLTLQLYGQLFLSGGQYSRFREVQDPQSVMAVTRVPSFDGARVHFDSAATQYAITGGGELPFAFAGPDFSDRETHVNFLLRWEFHPGSTFFVALTHQQTDDGVTYFQLSNDLQRLLRAPGTNALSVKLSYLVFRYHAHDGCKP